MISETGVQPNEQPQAPVLFILVAPGTIRVGTCEHCTLVEQGRPARAWDAQGDRELDFDRDALLAKLATLGVVMANKEEYVCP